MSSSSILTLSFPYLYKKSIQPLQSPLFYLMETKVHTTPTKSIILLNGNFTARVGTDFSELIPDEVVKYSLDETEVSA